MLTCRCTAKVFKRLKVKPSDAPPASSGRLGDWYVNLLYWQPQVLLCVSERTLLPVIIPAKDGSSFPARLAASAQVLLREIGIPETLVDEELAAMQPVALAKTADRRVLGSMNEFAFLAEATLAYEPAMGLHRLALRLSLTPCGPLKLIFPVDATRDLFGEHRLSPAEFRELEGR